MLSLPPVLLVWAILTFTVALVTYVMQGGIQNPTLLTRLSAWAILGILLVLLIVIIFALYTFSIVWKFRQRSQTLFHRIKNSWNTCLYA
jgi:Na+/proline symporter